MTEPTERGELTGFHVVDPDMYDRYRAEIVRMSTSHQVDVNEFLPDGVRRRGLSTPRSPIGSVWTSGT